MKWFKSLFKNYPKMYKLRPNSMQIPRYLTPLRVFLFTSLLITIRVGQLTPSHKIDLYAIAIGEVGAKRPRETWRQWETWRPWPVFQSPNIYTYKGIVTSLSKKQGPDAKQCPYSYIIIINVTFNPACITVKRKSRIATAWVWFTVALGQFFSFLPRLVHVYTVYALMHYVYIAVPYTLYLVFPTILHCTETDRQTDRQTVIHTDI